MIAPTSRAWSSDGDGARAPTADPQPLLRVEDLRVRYPLAGGFLGSQPRWLMAVDGVSFDIPRGSTLALVGESGSGKTTVARAIVRLQDVFAGSVWLEGDNLLTLRGRALRRHRRRFQMVFQDPFSSLDPRRTVGQTVREPLEIHDLVPRGNVSARVNELLVQVGLEPSHASRMPHEMSGGQRQRVGIARALAAEPSLLVCDEPVSALDVSIRAQVINLLVELQNQLGLTYLLIAHDLAVVRHVASTVAVMYLGKLVEMADAQELYGHPRHPYTAALLSAVPVPDAVVERRRQRIILRGDMPNPADPPAGCRFSSRCWLRERLGNPEICVTTEPALTPTPGDGAHVVACHFPEDHASLTTGALLDAGR